MSGKRYEGRNLEDALEQAAKDLGVERYQIEYHVELEKRGFLGGVKRVVIEAMISENPTAPVEAAPSMRPASRPLPMARPADGAPRARAPRQEKGDRPVRGRETRGSGGRGEGRGPRREQSRAPERAQNPREPLPEQGPESSEARELRGWLETVFELGRFELDIRSEENDERISLQLYGPASTTVLQRDGELLDALQILVNKAFKGRSIEKSIELDCGGFKQQRSGDLERKARELADRVRREGQEQMLPAMNPIERRIIHLALQDDRDVSTESRGEGFYKRIAIIRKRPEDSVSADS